MNAAKLLIRCDGNETIGLGHIVRCLALADALRKCSIESVFAVQVPSTASNMALACGYKVLAWRGNELAEVNILKWCAEYNLQAIVFDVRDDLSIAKMQSLRRQKLLLVDIDDTEDKRQYMDIVFYPPIPQLQQWTWINFTGELCSGWQWIVLRSQFSILRNKASKRKHMRILLTFGGSDPYGLTILSLAALANIAGDDRFVLDIVVGRECRQQAKIIKIAREHKTTWRCFVYRSVDDMAELMSRADLAIAAMGVTAYELVACRTPAVLLSISQDHYLSSRCIVEAGGALSLNFTKDTSELQKQLENKLAIVLHNRPLLKKMQRNCGNMIDGCGASRIAKKIFERITANA